MASNQIKSQETQELSEHKNLCCRFCKGSNIIKRGHRKTENRGRIQRYRCNDCKRRFVPDDGFFRMRNNPQKITLCMDMFYRGVSTRNVREHLQAFYPHNADHSTILRWLWKYASMISTFTNSLPLTVGDELQVDEIEYHRRKSHKKGKRGVAKEWFIDSIDPETKFMVASGYPRN